MLEDAGVEVGSRARKRIDETVFRAFVAALPVDHHRRGQHQPLAARREHLREQHRGGEVVVAAVGRRVGGVHSRAHDRRLMAHHVDTLEQRRQRCGVADVDAPHVGGQFGIGAVRGREHRVDSHHLVARRRPAPRPPALPMNPAAPVSSTLTADRTAARRRRAAGSGCRCDTLAVFSMASCTSFLNGTRLRSNSANTSIARTPVSRRRCPRPDRSPKQWRRNTFRARGPAPPRDSRSC